MKTAALIFPHQLFEHNQIVERADVVFMIEDYLFFRQYTFHVQKLILHRASMKVYQEYLVQMGKKVVYIESAKLLERKQWGEYVQKEGVTKLICYEVVDNWLSQDIEFVAQNLGVDIEYVRTPMFINSKEDNQQFFSTTKKPFMKSFYEWQRKRLGILIDSDGDPTGGVFSFDTENRKKIPKGYVSPEQYSVSDQVCIAEAKAYVRTYFSANYGSVDDFNYAIDFQGAKQALDMFIEKRLVHFGDYEDAISSEQTIINHSVLTPYLNIGLITPEYVIAEVLKKSGDAQITLNNLEGFVRQIIGWREFMRAMYDIYGTRMRNANFFNNQQNIPAAYWKGETGNRVLDKTIKRVLKHAYCHHIERLMVLGNYMLLSESKPEDVYTWFMELFIDAYDWVMVPNVYGMSQFADGGIFATKPYICASNYIVKMSDYKKDGVWDIDFDTKFWNFLKKHKVFFEKNVRFKMLLGRLRG